MPTVEALAEEARRAPNGYVEFLRVPAMSAGVYRLPKGGEDRQSPHGEEEFYYIVRGRARFRLGETERPVGPGDLVFVPAQEPHRFVRIEEELLALVVFAPAEQPAPVSPTPSGG